MEIERQRSPAVRAELQRRRAAPVYALRAQQAGAERLELELKKLRKRRELARARWSPERELARELDVPAARLRRWLRAGQVPASFMPQLDRWAQDAQEEAERQLREQGQVEGLLEQAKRPGWGPRLPGGGRQPARRAPDFRDEQGRVEGESYSGFSWNLRVEDWFSYEGLDEWCTWALSLRRRDLPRHARQHRYWIVTALTSQLLRPGMKGPRSPGGYRHFAQRSQRALGARLNIGAAVSSGRVPSGGLEEAVRRFREAFDDEASAGARIYVHGIVVRNWRVRTEGEQSSYRQRREDAIERAQAERARQQAERRSEARSRARQTSQARAKQRSRSRRKS